MKINIKTFSQENANSKTNSKSLSIISGNNKILSNKPKKDPKNNNSNIFNLILIISILAVVIAAIARLPESKVIIY